MGYFIVNQDKRVQNAVEPMGLSKLINKTFLKESEMDKQAIIQVDIREKKLNEYVDFIERPFHLVSDNLKTILQKYDERIFFKPIVLYDKKAESQKLYWLMEPRTVDCLDEEARFNKDDSIKKLVLNESKIEKAKIFKIKGVFENFIIIRLDVAESILRRDFNGIALKKVEVRRNLV